MTQRYQSAPGNGLYGTNIKPAAVPDYSGLIDSLVNAFAMTRSGIIQRGILQNQAANAKRQQDREDEQLKISQRRADLEEANAANSLAEKGYSEVNPSQPQIGDDGKPLQLRRIGQRAFVLNPANTPQAKHGKLIDSLTDPKLTPEDRQLLKENPDAWKQYLSVRYGAASTKPTIDEDVDKAKRIAEATRGIPTYGELHPHAAAVDSRPKWEIKETNGGLVRVDANTGQVAPLQGADGKAVHGKASDNGNARMVKLREAASVFQNAHQEMLPFEAALKAGKAHISTLDQTLANTALAVEGHGLLSGASRAAAMSALDAHNPDLAQYVRTTLGAAEAEASLTGSSNIYKTKVSEFLNGARAGAASPKNIEAIQRHRQSVLDQMPNLNNFNPDDPGATAPISEPSSAPAGTKKRTAAEILAAHGIK